MNELIAYQPGDFTQEQQTGQQLYLGPIYDVTYPQAAQLLADIEVRGWSVLGYRVQDPVLQADVQARTEFTIRVLGDLPDWFQENLRKEIGATCKLIKPRGTSTLLSK
ncbi:MAG: hypothetical protein AABY00_02290 [Nanoarchaeota archaeon]